MSGNLEGTFRRIASSASIDRIKVEISSSQEQLSSASPVIWESLLQNLSAALPVIFNTSSVFDKYDLTQSHSESILRSEKHLHPEACAFGIRGSYVRGSLTILERKRPVSGGCGMELENKQDFQPMPAGLGRSIRVRHEETEDMLNQSLTMICRQKSPRSSSSLAPSDETRNGAAGLKLKESLKSGIRVKIDISQYNLDNIVVAVTSDDVLNVYVAGNDKQDLHSLQLLPNPPVQSLACSIVDGTSLYIREKSKEAMVYEYSANSCRFLPVVVLDETLLKFTIIFHIPEQVAFENLVIKTVDESLVIKGCQNSSVHHQAGDFFFRVMVALPDGADNRSVTARMIEFNQVIIEGCLGHASRRMTCNF